MFVQGQWYLEIELRIVRVDVDGVGYSCDAGMYDVAKNNLDFASHRSD